MAWRSGPGKRKQTFVAKVPEECTRCQCCARPATRAEVAGAHGEPAGIRGSLGKSLYVVQTESHRTAFMSLICCDGELGSEAMVGKTAQ